MVPSNFKKPFRMEISVHFKNDLQQSVQVLALCYQTFLFIENLRIILPWDAEIITIHYCISMEIKHLCFSK